jgi:hypothetical protein
MPRNEEDSEYSSFDSIGVAIIVGMVLTIPFIAFVGEDCNMAYKEPGCNFIDVCYNQCMTRHSLYNVLGVIGCLMMTIPPIAYVLSLLCSRDDRIRQN